MFITLKKNLLFYGCLILVGIVAFYFHQQNKPDPEPIKIYNAPKQEAAMKAPPVETALTEGTPIEDSHAGHDHPPHEHSQDTPGISTPAVMDTSTLEKNDDLLSEEAIKKWVTEVMEDLEWLDKYFLEKYPELFEIGMMTKEEFLGKYSTPEAQKELVEYVQRVQPKIFAEVRAVYSNIPIEIVDDILLETKDHFVELWGQETADQVMQQLKTELGL